MPKWRSSRFLKDPGSFSIVALMLDGQPTLVVLRDPYGIRPAVIGKRGDGAWIASSESVALDVLSFEVESEPAPGEALFLRAGQPIIRKVLHSVRSTPCVFEHIYFARPDSVMDSKSVYEQRLGYVRALGERIRAKGYRVMLWCPYQIPLGLRPRPWLRNWPCPCVRASSRIDTAAEHLLCRIKIPAMRRS